VIWTPLAELYHLESASRGTDVRPGGVVERFQREVDHMRERWGYVLDNDPFYGPNFDRMHGDYRLASPPLRERPWLNHERPARPVYFEDAVAQPARKIV
jgi:hypothetical protein